MLSNVTTWFGCRRRLSSRRVSSSAILFRLGVSVISRFRRLCRWLVISGVGRIGRVGKRAFCFCRWFIFIIGTGITSVVIIRVILVFVCSLGLRFSCVTGAAVRSRVIRSSGRASLRCFR